MFDLSHRDGHTGHQWRTSIVGDSWIKITSAKFGRSKKSRWLGGAWTGTVTVLLAIAPLPAAAAATCTSPALSMECLSVNNFDRLPGTLSLAPNQPSTAQSVDIVTRGADSDGIQIVSSGAITISNNRAITTFGNNSRGIYASGAGDVAISGKGPIRTYGAFAPGIYAHSANDGVAVVASRIVTSGVYSDGIHAVAPAGPVSIFDAGSITTSGRNSRGIYASGANSVAISGNGPILTRGAFAPGIYAHSEDGPIDLQAGDVTTLGKYSDGVHAVAPNDVITISNTGAISTRGHNSRGIYASGANGVVISGNGSIATKGAFAPGIYAHSENGPVNLAAGDVTTAGVYSDGLHAVAPNDIVTIVNTGTISTTGRNSRGIYASGANGVVISGNGAIATQGAFAPGIYAHSKSGPIGLSAGDISTVGRYSDGIHAVAPNDVIAISNTGAIATGGRNSRGIYASGANGVAISGNGPIATKGGFAPGIYAHSENGPITLSAGNITTAGRYSDGVHAAAPNDTISISHTGSIATRGRNSAGIYAAGANGVTISGSGPIMTRGGFAAGIYADSANGSLAISSGAIITKGAYSHGIIATAANGSVRIQTQSVAVSGAGSYGILATGAGQVAVSGGSTTVRAEPAIAATSTAGNVSVSVTGRTTSGSRDAIDVTAAKTGLVNISDGAVVKGAVNGINVVSGTGALITTNGVLFTGTGYAIQTRGAASIVDNAGTINGRIALAAHGDLVNNTGLFAATADSDFGAGNDVFNNTGVVRILGGDFPVGSVTFSGLEHFNNSGLVALDNGRAGDVLDIPGTFHGSGRSMLSVDAQLGGPGSIADRLIVGTATGSTKILVTDVIPNMPGALNVRIPVVEASNSSPNAFTLANGPIDKGLLQYNLITDPASKTYSLIAVAGTPVLEAPKIIQGSQDLWYKSADAWADHLTEMRDEYWASGDQPFALDHNLWGHLYGSDWSRGGSQSFGGFGQTQTVNLAYDQNFVGFQAGYDMSMPLGTGTLIYGLTAGIGTSRLEFDATRDHTDYQTYNIGAYASYLAGPFFVNGLVKYDYTDLTSKSALGNYSADFGGNGIGILVETGYRFNAGKLFVEPVASIAWVQTDLDSFSVQGATLDFADTNSVRGTVGFRVGGTVDLPNGQAVTPYVGLDAVKEFESRDRVNFKSGGSIEAIDTGHPGAYGRVSVGVSAESLGDVSGLSGFVQATGDFGSTSGGGGMLGISYKW